MHGLAPCHRLPPCPRHVLQPCAWALPLPWALCHGPCCHVLAMPDPWWQVVALHRALLSEGVTLPAAAGEGVEPLNPVVRLAHAVAPNICFLSVGFRDGKKRQAPGLHLLPGVGG